MRSQRRAAEKGSYFEFSRVFCLFDLTPKQLPRADLCPEINDWPYIHLLKFIESNKLDNNNNKKVLKNEVFATRQDLISTKKSFVNYF